MKILAQTAQHVFKKSFKEGIQKKSFCNGRSFSYPPSYVAGYLGMTIPGGASVGFLVAADEAKDPCELISKGIVYGAGGALIGPLVPPVILAMIFVDWMGNDFR